MPFRACVADVVTSSEHPAVLTTLLCELVKVALLALREAQASGAADEMDEGTLAELAALVQGGEDDEAADEEGEAGGEEGEAGGEGGGAGEGGKNNQARGRKRRRRASARGLGTAGASPDASAEEAARAARLAARNDAAAARRSGADSSSVAQSTPRAALVRVIELLRSGEAGKRAVEAVVPELANILGPLGLLPTEPGRLLGVVDVVEKVCVASGLPHRVLQLDDQLRHDSDRDLPLTIHSEPTTGDLVLLRASASALADRFKSGWGSIDGCAVSLVPRAVVQYLPADSIPHFVLFTERPHYASEAFNPQGNRCALHCALMSIGVTDAWQRHLPYTASARSNARSPITCYDDFPLDGADGKRSMTRKRFEEELRKVRSDDARAEVYVICDTVQRAAGGEPNGPRDVAELLRWIAEADYGISSDRSSSLATPAMKEFNKQAPPEHQRVQPRGAALPDGFRIVQVRLIARRMSLSCSLTHPVHHGRHPTELSRRPSTSSTRSCACACSPILGRTA